MRPRTFILVILIVVVLAVLAVLFFINRSNGALGGGNDDQPTESAETIPADGEQEPVEPLPTATPSVFLQTVVVARLDLPVGTRLTEKLLMVEERPNTNIALQGGYTFESMDELIGQIIKVDIQKSDAILRPMLAIEASDLASFGSDLSLYVDRGRVAVAFPLTAFHDVDLLPIEIASGVSPLTPEEDPQFLDRIAQEKGIAFAMRPGDMVDVMMTAQIVEIDPEFRTALPNLSERVIESELSEGFLFFFPQTFQGRLEFIPEINQVVQIIPSANSSVGLDVLPKRVTQLAIQQAEVLWVGTWFNRQELEGLLVDASLDAAAQEAQGAGEESDESTEQAVEPIVFEEPPSVLSRLNPRPDVVILSMSPQDAIALKWAIERGIDIDLALRAQGDTQTFDTASVSLFQIIEQGGVAVPPPADFDLDPRPEAVSIPVLLSSVLDVEVITTGDGTAIEVQETTPEVEGQGGN